VLRAARLPWRRGTTASLQAAYPFLTAPGLAERLGGRGLYIGRDWHGGAFSFDPFELYAAGLLTNPNMLVVGQVGSGKSALVKTLLWRALAFGYTAWVADPKGEYGDLAAAAGAPVIRLGPDQAARLNPLDTDPIATDEAASLGNGRRDRVGSGDGRVRLVAALAATALGRPLQPVEHAAATLALDAVTRGAGRSVPVLPDLVEALLAPSPVAAGQVRMTVARFADATRDLALVMRRMCAGDLAGMFDAPTHLPGRTGNATSGAIDPDARLVVLDLSGVYRGNRDALPLVMCAATAWLQAAITRTAARPTSTHRNNHSENSAGDGDSGSVGVRRFVVVDEAWALLHQEPTARWLQASYKLARANGVVNIAVLHRFSDLAAAGPVGSATAALAGGLLADVGTRVVYNQPAAELAETRRALGLTGPETDLLAHLPRGHGLWKVGDRSWLVQHQRSAAERAMTDTDHAMRGDARTEPDIDAVAAIAAVDAAADQTSAGESR
jgi:hypothetical protein